MSEERRPMAPSVMSYVTGVILGAIIVEVLALIGGPAPDPRAILFWGAAFLAGELMWLHTPTGKGNVSMAAVVHIAGVLTVGPWILVPAAWASRLVVGLAFHRQAWYRAVFNGAQVSLAVLAAAGAYRILGGSFPAELSGSGFPKVFGAVAAASATYYFVNVGIVSGVIALGSGVRLWTAWRENYGYRVELASSAALFLLAPVAALTHQSLGPIGLAVFLMPMLFIRDAGDRFIALERTQRALIGSERLAAKGEMAASIGHELNNYLSVVNGNLQILEMKRKDLLSGPERDRMGVISEQIQRMSTLSKGLMDFSRLNSKPMPTEVARLVEETVEFLRPQNRFDGIDVSLERDPRVGVIVLDPAQLQQVLMNLLNNAADALGEAPTTRPGISIWVRLRATENRVEIGVCDNGTGIPEALRRRIFEPGFSTKETGHGFGLSTVYRIVENHRGTIRYEEAPGGGALFRILLPVPTSDSWPRAA